MRPAGTSRRVSARCSTWTTPRGRAVHLPPAQGSDLPPAQACRHSLPEPCRRPTSPRGRSLDVPAGVPPGVRRAQAVHLRRRRRSLLAGPSTSPLIPGRTVRCCTWSTPRAARSTSRWRKDVATASRNPAGDRRAPEAGRWTCRQVFHLEHAARRRSTSGGAGGQSSRRPKRVATDPGNPTDLRNTRVTDAPAAASRWTCCRVPSGIRRGQAVDLPTAQARRHRSPKPHRSPEHAGDRRARRGQSRDVPSGVPRGTRRGQAVDLPTARAVQSSRRPTHGATDPRNPTDPRNTPVTDAPAGRVAGRAVGCSTWNTPFAGGRPPAGESGPILPPAQARRHSSPEHHRFPEHAGDRRARRGQSLACCRVFHMEHAFRRRSTSRRRRRSNPPAGPHTAPQFPGTPQAPRNTPVTDGPAEARRSTSRPLFHVGTRRGRAVDLPPAHARRHSSPEPHRSRNTPVTDAPAGASRWTCCLVFHVEHAFRRRSTSRRRKRSNPSAGASTSPQIPRPHEHPGTRR